MHNHSRELCQDLNRFAPDLWWSASSFLTAQVDREDGDALCESAQNSP